MEVQVKGLSLVHKQFLGRRAKLLDKVREDKASEGNKSYRHEGNGVHSRDGRTKCNGVAEGYAGKD